MTGELKEQRRARALMLGLVAGGFSAVAAVTVLIDARASRPEQDAAYVLPGLAQRIGSAQRITIVSTDASYQIERVRRGEQDVWLMRDRGDYPVAAGPLARLTSGLETLQTTRRMTNDPSKHDRLGVGDPRADGRGILIQIEDANRALLTDLIVGVEPSGALYVRRPNEDQTWAARGDLPPLRDASAWMDLSPLDLEAGQLTRVEIVPAEGRAYILAREEGPDANFTLAAPALAASSSFVLNDAASRLTRLQPVDVQSAPAVQGAVRARVRAHTVDNLLIDAEVIDADGAPWVKLVARAQAPEQEQAALALNARMAEWAFKLRAEDAAGLAPPLSTLLPQPASPTN